MSVVEIESVAESVDIGIAGVGGGGEYGCSDPDRDSHCDETRACREGARRGGRPGWILTAKEGTARELGQLDDYP